MNRIEANLPVIRGPGFDPQLYICVAARGSRKSAAPLQSEARVLNGAQPLEEAAAMFWGGSRLK